MSFRMTGDINVFLLASHSLEYFRNLLGEKTMRKSSRRKSLKGGNG